MNLCTILPGMIVHFLFVTLLFSAETKTKPAVLFHGGIHGGGGVHSEYVVKPLVALGVAVDVCGSDSLAVKLASGRYNVVIVSTMIEKDRNAVDTFLAAGGGVFVCNPSSGIAGIYGAEHYTGTIEWLVQYGIKTRREIFVENDPKNVYTDIMGTAHSWSGTVLPPMNEGVRGIMVFLKELPVAWEPPMSFDLSPEWRVVARGAKSLSAIPATAHEKIYKGWIPAKPISSEPPLLAIREIKNGRMAIGAVKYHWLFNPPVNCPTSKVILTAGTGDKPSDWLRLCANTFAWLAQPSLAKGMGGAHTPKELIDPPARVWETPAVYKWDTIPSIKKIPDVQRMEGLIGAQSVVSGGKGTVHEFAAAARAAGLQFLVFLENSMKMEQTQWDSLVQWCGRESDSAFAAIPGLLYEDAQGNHIYSFAGKTNFPKPNMLLSDRRLATNTSIRTDVMFDYVLGYLEHNSIFGYWQHAKNFINCADYKLYNSFPIYSFSHDSTIDSAFKDYSHFMSIGYCQAPLAFEIMTTPEQVGERAKNGWRVALFKTYEPTGGADYRIRSVTDLSANWPSAALSFCGSGSQYITNGPTITLWDAMNRMAMSNGLWFRPDLCEYRVRIRTISDTGLKSVELYDGRTVFRRWLPGGAKSFEQELVFTNDRQRGLFLVVEDVRGRRAISSEFWNRNLMLEEFICTDRCNFLGNARLRAKNGKDAWTQTGFRPNMAVTPSKGQMALEVVPSLALTLDAPTLPIDGMPIGVGDAGINFGIAVPGELPTLFGYPATYLISPEVAIGQTDYVYGYDPAEAGARITPLGHPYVQPQQGCGNAWGSWHRLLPVRKVTGLSRTYACNWLVGGFRTGMHETRLACIDTVHPMNRRIPVMSVWQGGWRLYVDGREVKAGADTLRGPFKPGTYVVREGTGGGGADIIMPIEGELEYAYAGDGSIGLAYVSQKDILTHGDSICFRVGFAGASSGTTVAVIHDYARKFGVEVPGRTGYVVRMNSGKVIGNNVFLRLDAGPSAVDFEISRIAMPGFLPVIVENLCDRWSVFLVDRAAPVPNYRGIAVKEGRAIAQIDINDFDHGYFIGHPVLCSNPDARVMVSWKQTGIWYVEVHNPKETAMKINCRTHPAWKVFNLSKNVKLGAGESCVWEVQEKK